MNNTFQIIQAFSMSNYNNNIFDRRQLKNLLIKNYNNFTQEEYNFVIDCLMEHLDYLLENDKLSYEWLYMYHLVAFFSKYKFPEHHFITIFVVMEKFNKLHELEVLIRKGNTLEGELLDYVKEKVINEGNYSMAELLQCQNEKLKPKEFIKAIKNNFELVEIIINYHDIPKKYIHYLLMKSIDNGYYPNIVAILNKGFELTKEDIIRARKKNNHIIYEYMIKYYYNQHK